MKEIVQKNFTNLKATQIFKQFCTNKLLERSNFEKIMHSNKKWATNHVQRQPDYFKKLVNVQRPKYLWIGCSDSRVPAN